MNLHIGQVLKGKKISESARHGDCTVVDIYNNSALLDYKPGVQYVKSFDLIKEHYEIPEEKWKINQGDKVWIPTVTDRELANYVFADKSIKFGHLVDRKIVCRTKAEAVECAKRMLAAVQS